MDMRMIDVGKSRIALNMIGFGFTLAPGLIFVRILGTGQGIRTGPMNWGEIVAFLFIFFVFWAIVLLIMGRCLGGIVWGIAEVVRGVNSERPFAPGKGRNHELHEKCAHE
jgi:hypothetical protein